MVFSRLLSFRLAICVLAFMALRSEVAFAQFMPNMPPPHREVTSDGVDTMTGDLIYSNKDISVGSDDGPGPLAFVRTYSTQNGVNYAYPNLGTSFTHNFQIYLESFPIDSTSTLFRIVVGTAGYSFDTTPSGSVSRNGDGATLLAEPGGMVLVLKDGTRIDFGHSYTSVGTFYVEGDRYFNYGATSITYPNGETIFLKYEPAASTPTDGVIHRLASVTNSNGYSLNFSYLDPSTSGGLNQEKFLVSRVSADRISCTSAVTNCSPSGSAHADYEYVLLTTLPDGQKVYGLGKYTAVDGKYVSYGYNANYGISSISRNGSSNPDLAISKPTPLDTWFTDGDGKIKKYALSTDGSIYSVKMTITDATGLVTKAGGGSGDLRPVWTEDGFGRRTEYAYDMYGRLLSTKYPEGNITAQTYDSRGNVIERREKAKPGSGLSDIVTTSVFSSCNSTNAKICNRPTYTIDGKGNRTDYFYDPAHGGETVTLSPPNQAGLRTVTRYGYSSFYPAPGVVAGAGATLPSAWLQTVIDECLVSAVTGTTVDFSYVCPPASRVRRSLVYTPSSSGARSSHELEQVIDDADGLALTTKYTYRRDGRLASEDGARAGSADLAVYDYDIAGRRTSVSFPNAGSGAPAQQFGYDSVGRLRETKRRLGSGWVSETSTFNGRGLVATSTAGDGTLTSYVYDDAGRLKDETIALATPRVTRRTYNQAGMLEKVIRGVGTASQQDYATYSYSANGQVVSEQDANGNLTTRCYDGFDRVVELRLPAPDAVPGAAPNCTTIAAGQGLPAGVTREEYGYDANGNLATLRQRDGQLLTFTYDALDRVVHKAVPGLDRSVSSTYDLLGRRTSASLPGSNSALSVSWTYDNADRVKTSTTQGRTVAYEYDPSGETVDTVWPDGLATRYTMDNFDRVTSVVERNGPALASYSYDQLSRRTANNYANGATATSFTYDASQRLAQLSHDLAGAGSDISLAYTYNEAGQIATKQQNNSAYAWTGAYNVERPYTRNALNQYQTAGPATFSYDTRGNLTSDGSWTFSYDGENRLVTATGGGNVSLAYDAIGRLARITSGSSTTSFLYDGENLIGEYDGAGSLLRRTVFGPGEDEPAVTYEGSGRYWLYSNEQRSIIARADATGTATSITSYGFYGESVSGDRFGYTGQIRIPELGLYYYKSRFYSPFLGRFLQPDPTGTDGGMNLYEYAASDPINLIDPTGNKPGGQNSTAPYEPVNEDEITVVGRRIREGASFLIGLTPLGFPADVYTAFSGKDGITGERVSTFWRIAGVVPYVSEFRKGYKGVRVLVRVVKGCGCFEAGTLVATPSGMRPIEQIKIGDEVLAGDEVSGKVSPRKVMALLRPEPKPLYDLRLRAPAGDIVTFHVTDDHPWKVEGQGWVETVDLKVDQRIDTATGADMVVVGRSLTTQVAPTYNLSVADLNTFFVGKDKVWVHNGGCWKAFASRSAAFRQAKRDAGIPVNQQPKSVGPNVNKQGKVVQGREYVFSKPDGSTVRIREDAGGHPEHGLGPHFNINGSKTHYGW